MGYRGEDCVQVTACRCGKIHGWWERRVQNYRLVFHADGTFADAAGLDEDTYERGGVRKFCAECDRDITDRVVPKLTGEKE